MGLPGHYIPEGTFQLLPIVQITAQDNLGMILHIRRFQLVQLGRQVASRPAAQQLLPKVRIGALHRYKQR